MNNKKDITKELGTGKILPLVLRLSFPAVIAQLITFLYNIVDRMYVAKIASHGMYALAALGIVLPITLILEAFSSLIGLGKRRGARDRRALLSRVFVRLDHVLCSNDAAKYQRGAGAGARRTAARRHTQGGHSDSALLYSDAFSRLLRSLSFRRNCRYHRGTHHGDRDFYHLPAHFQKA